MHMSEVAPNQRAEEPSAGGSATPPRPPTQTRRIVVAEDDDMLRELLCRALVRAGYEATPARNGEEAVRLVMQAPPDLLLTDLIMPEKEGFETIVEVRRKHPQMPIIAMSGGGRIQPECYLPIASKLGAARTLAKPFSLDLLISTVQELLGQKS
jgi:DNA-binding response OmpR family regulator